MPLGTELETKSIPPGVRVERFEPGSRTPDSSRSVRLRVSCVWGEPPAVRALLKQAFALLLIWISFAAPFQAGPPVLEALLRILIGCGGVLASYLGLTEGLNSTVVALGEDALTIHHGPIPWPGGRRLTLESLVATQTVSFGDEGLLYSVDILTEVKSYRAIPRLASRDAAEFVSSVLNAEIANLQSEIRANAGT